MAEPPIIDHDPDEPPPDRTGSWPYWLGGLMIVVLWIGSLVSMDLDWHSVILGALTGAVFMVIGLGYTGNRVPKWMRPTDRK